MNIRHRKVLSIMQRLPRDLELDMLNAIKPNLYGPYVVESFMDLGLPSALEDRKRARRERMYRRLFWPLIVFVALSIGISIGWNVHLALGL